MARVHATENGDIPLTEDEETARDLEESDWTSKAPARASKERARTRRIAYGSLAEQLDQQYWDGLNSTTVWADHIASVKASHPKP